MADALKRIGPAVLEAQRRWMTSTTPRQRWWVGMSFFGMLLITGGLAWLSTRVEWRPLYTDMDPRGAQQAAAELAAEKIPYQLDASETTVRVPATLIDKARLGLAAKGLPQSGRLGFELFDKPNWVGSEFDEQVNYQRALEGELERTISSIEAVQSARVHLVLPHDSLFQEQQRPAKASVVIKLARRGLSDAEAGSIRTLVSSAVDGLDPENVTLVDADGQSFFGQKDAQTQAAAYEQLLTERLMATLEPIAGRENIRASVNVDFDSSDQDDTQETYDPNGAVITSTERSDQGNGAGQPRPAGIPGTASNAPNGGGATTGATPAAAPPLFPPATSSSENSHQENNSYVVSKHTRHVVQGPGQVKRLTVAILVNDKLMTAGSGKVAERKFVSLSPEELNRVGELAKAAVGFDPARGDRIAVENITFADNAIPPPPTLLKRLAPRADQVSAAMWLLGPIAMFLLLFFFVFRPVGRSVQQQFAPSELSSGMEGRVVPENLTANLREALPDLTGVRPHSRARMLREAVGERMMQEPAPVVRLVKSWITDTGKSE
jgi:flagellar M-ring protein FliF